MAEYIEAATEPLSADKGTMEAELNAVCAELQQLFQEMEELDSMWDGPASQAFAVQFQTDYQIDHAGHYRESERVYSVYAVCCR